MRDINEVAEKMARNCFEIAKSLGCAFRFESEFNTNLFIFLLQIKKQMFSHVLGEIFPSLCNATVPIIAVIILMKKTVIKVT